MVLSEFAVVGVFEAFLVVFLGVLVLLFYNHRLRQRITNSQKIIAQLKKPGFSHPSQEGSTNHNKKEPLRKKEYEQEKVPAENQYIPMTYREIKKTQIYFQSIAPGESMSLDMACTKSTTASLRHLFLCAEVLAEKAENEQIKWQTLETRLKPILKKISDNPASAGTDIDTNEATEANQDLLNRNLYANLADAAASILTDCSLDAQQKLIDTITSTSETLGFDDITIPSINNALADSSSVATPSPTPDQTQAQSNISH
ncbi:MAG: hypothetical protein KUG79_00755 [Pseudomonadales bacterium]|nr:hypothetical protein [Pseudomonadales bacterium]